MFKVKDIKKMSRKDLLDLLVLQSKKIDELQEKLDKTERLLEDKKILILESGSIAEACLKLNKVFEVAEETANQYLENVRRIEQEQEEMLLKLKREREEIKLKLEKYKKKKLTTIKKKSEKKSQMVKVFESKI